MNIVSGPILIVDDEAQNLALLQQVLQADYPLVFAKTGQQAMEAVQKHRPSLILLDIQLPDISGFEVCFRLKSDDATAQIPIIFVTGQIDTADEVMGLKNGGADYIHKPIVPEIVKIRVDNQIRLLKTSSLERSYSDAISMLSEAGHYNDTDTGFHVWRMSAYAKAIAEAVGWSPYQCDMIEKAAPLHDTGKIGVPDRVLKKPAALTDEEWNQMKAHPEIGYSILSRSHAPVFKMAAEIARYHHEKWDGSGYPFGLKGEDIPMSARIVALADVYDALTSRRPYKEPWSEEDALAFIDEQRGKQFDPELVELFNQIIVKIRRIQAEFAAKDDSDLLSL